MPSCCIVSCRNRPEKCLPGVKFYKFSYVPHRKPQRDLWIQAVRRENDKTSWEPTANSTICSCHFVGGEKSQHPESPSFIPTIFPTMYKVPNKTEEAVQTSQKKMSEAVPLLSVDQIKLEDQELFLNECRNDQEDNQSFPEEFAEGKKIWARKDFILSNSSKSDAVHSLLVNEVKQEDSFIVKESYFSESRNDDNDSKSFQELVIEEDKFWKRENFDLPEYWKSEDVHSLSVGDVKLEDNSSLKESSYIKGRNDDEDSKSFQEKEDFLIPESCVSRCVEEQLNDTELPKYGYSETIKKTDVNNRCGNNASNESNLNCGIGNVISDNYSNEICGNNGGLECQVDNIRPELKKHRCHMCEYATNHKRSLKLHIDGVHLKSKDYKCHMCEYAASQKGSLKTHINSVHLKLNNRKCHMCDYTTSRKDCLKSHIDSVHLKLKNHKCHLCEYAATHKRRLQYHIDDVHLKLKNHKCQVCEHTAASIGSLRKHVDAVHLKLKHHKCQQCEYATAHKMSLRYHIKSVHLKLKDMKCHLCEYTTAQAGSLKYHIKRVHMKLQDHKVRDKIHKCHMCQYTTAYKGSLKLHINSVHLKNKNHKCHICEFSTSQKTNLKLHIDNVHLKLKNYKCHMCEYTASQKVHLNSHIISVHLKCRNLKCDMCEYSTSIKSNLSAHIKRVHSK